MEFLSLNLKRYNQVINNFNIKCLIDLGFNHFSGNYTTT